MATFCPDGPRISRRNSNTMGKRELEREWVREEISGSGIEGSSGHEGGGCLPRHPVYISQTEPSHIPILKTHGGLCVESK